MAKKREGMDTQLFENTKKKLNMIMEYTVLNGIIDEDGENDNKKDGPMPDPQAMQNDPMGSPQGGQQNGPMGDSQGAQQGDPMSDTMGGPMPQGPDQSAGMGQDMGGQQMPQGEQQQGPEGFNPNVEDIAPTDFEGGEDTPSSDDDVVDVTELTDAQKNTDKEIEALGNKFSEIVKKLNDFTDFIKGNDKKIDDLRAEIERRNPTQIEKLSMNTAKGGPFTVSPEEYWDEKEEEGEYSREDDNNGKGQGKYVITANDVNGAVDWREIAKSLDARNEDFIWHQTLNEALKY